MRSIILAATLALATLPALAQTVASTGPEEVGTTTMPPGQYIITEQNSKKSYTLTVTQKGNMILGAAPEGAQATTATTATPSTPTPAKAAEAVGGAVGATGAAAVTTAGSILPTATGVAGGAIKGLMQQGFNRGMSELVKQGGTKKLDSLLK